MNRWHIALILSLLSTPVLADQSASVSWTPDAYRALFACSEKVLKISPDTIDKVALDDDLLYVRDVPTKSLYVYTPDFAGRANLEVDPYGQNGGKSFVRLPYWPSDPSKVKGFWYLPFGTNALFLPGKAQDKPNFKNYKSPGYVSVTSINGKPWPPNDYVSYPLAIEDEIWNPSAKNKLSPNDIQFLINSTALRLQYLPAVLKAGTPMNQGHAGQWVMSQEMADYNNKLRQDALDACHATANTYQLKLFPPSNSPAPSAAPTKKIKLVMQTDPPGLWCRCTGELFWGTKDPQSIRDNTFIVDKTPEPLELPTGVYKSVLCRCILEDSKNICSRMNFKFFGEAGGTLDNDMLQQRNFLTIDGVHAERADCRVLDMHRCRSVKDCFNTGSGGFGTCYRKDIITGINYSPDQRANSKGCECFKGACEVTPEYTASLLREEQKREAQGRLSESEIKTLTTASQKDIKKLEKLYDEVDIGDPPEKVQQLFKPYQNTAYVKGYDRLLYDIDLPSHAKFVYRYHIEFKINKATQVIEKKSKNLIDVAHPYAPQGGFNSL